MVDSEEHLEAAVSETADIRLLESIVELKQMKAKAKSTFTKVRRRLLVFIRCY